MFGRRVKIAVKLNWPMRIQVGLKEKDPLLLPNFPKISTQQQGHLPGPPTCSGPSAQTHYKAGFTRTSAPQLLPNTGLQGRRGRTRTKVHMRGRSHTQRARDRFPCHLTLSLGPFLESPFYETLSRPPPRATDQGQQALEHPSCLWSPPLRDDNFTKNMS